MHLIKALHLGAEALLNLELHLILWVYNVLDSPNHESINLTSHYHNPKW